MIAYLQGGAFNGDQLLSEPSIEEMLTLQIQGIENTQGLNWYQTEIYLSGGGVVDLWGHNGGESGATTDLYIDPENEIGVVVLSNAEGENLYVVDELYDYALALSTSGVGNPACGTVSVAEASIGEVPPSLYPNPASGAFTIASESGGLFILYSAQGKEVLREEVGPREQMSTSKLEVGHYTGRLNNAYFKLIIQ
jgi:CubicO group peptidase (beta-lactamase class C family)